MSGGDLFVIQSVIQKKRTKMLVELALQYDNTMAKFKTYCLKKEKTLHISCRLTVAATWIALIMSAVTKTNTKTMTKTKTPRE